MNSSIIRYILGHILNIEGIMLFIPCIVAAIYKEQEGFAFLGVAFLCLLLGFLMTFKKPVSQVFYLKEGCAATSLSWIFLSFFGALPFYFSGDIPSLTNALFETISGFTTTGSSILTDVESLSHCSIFWRSFTHWIGGMGVLVFMLAIIPMSGGSNINLMKAESTGASVGKLVPKIRYTARILYMIYIGMSVIQLIFLLLGKMPLFDALCTTFGTAGTGGFGIKNDSMAGYSVYIQWVTAIFMLLFGISFNTYYYMLYRNFKKAFGQEEVKCYLLIIAASTLFIFFQILDMVKNGFEALTQSFFQVVSIITSTGFATADYEQWSQPCTTLLVFLMFIGACAGSTGGGIKVSRFILIFKTVIKELNSYIHPKSVKKIKIDKKPVEHEVVRSVNVYFMTFFLIFVASLFLISFNGKDIVTSFTAVTTTLNNIGPGLAGVGPTQNFSHFSVFSKFILMFDMLAGRLELFPLLILFHPALWKDLLTQQKAEARR